MYEFNSDEESTELKDFGGSSTLQLPSSGGDYEEWEEGGDSNAHNGGFSNEDLGKGKKKENKEEGEKGGEKEATSSDGEDEIQRGRSSVSVFSKERKQNKPKQGRNIEGKNYRVPASVRGNPGTFAETVEIDGRLYIPLDNTPTKNDSPKLTVSSSIQALTITAKNTVFNPDSYKFGDEDTAWKALKKHITIKEISLWVWAGGWGFAAAYLFWIGGGKGAAAILADIVETGADLPSWFADFFSFFKTFTMVVGAAENGALTAITTKDISADLLDWASKKNPDDEIEKAKQYLKFMDKTWSDRIKGFGRTGMNHLLSFASMFPIVFLGLTDFGPLSITFSVIGAATQYGPNVVGVAALPFGSSIDNSRKILLEVLSKQLSSFFSMKGLVVDCYFHEIKGDSLDVTGLQKLVGNNVPCYVRLKPEAESDDDDEEKISNNGKLYYVFKKGDKYAYKEFKILPETLRELDEELKTTDKGEPLSEEQLAAITLSTGHTHNEGERQLIQKIQVEIIDELTAEWPTENPEQEFRKRLAQLLTLEQRIKEEKEKISKQSNEKTLNYDDGKIQISAKKSETVRNVAGFITGSIGGALFYGYVESPVGDMKELADKITFLQPDSVRIPLTVVAVLGTLVPYIGLGYIAGNAILDPEDAIKNVYGTKMGWLRWALKLFVNIVSPLSGATNYFLNEAAAKEVLNLFHSGATTTKIISAILGGMGGVAAGTVNGKYTFLMIDRILMFLANVCGDENIKKLYSFHANVNQFADSIKAISEERYTQLLRDFLTQPFHVDEEAGILKQDNPLRNVLFSYFSDETRLSEAGYTQLRDKVGSQWLPTWSVAGSNFHYIPEEVAPKKPERDSFSWFGSRKRLGYTLNNGGDLETGRSLTTNKNDSDDKAVSPSSWLSYFSCCGGDDNSLVANTTKERLIVGLCCCCPGFASSLCDKPDEDRRVLSGAERKPGFFEGILSCCFPDNEEEKSLLSPSHH